MTRALLAIAGVMLLWTCFLLAPSWTIFGLMVGGWVTGRSPLLGHCRGGRR